MNKIVLLIVILMNVLQARIVYVDSASQAVNADGSSWTNAFTTLQDGIKAARNKDEIRIAAGTYFTSYNKERNDHFSIPSDIKICGGYERGTARRFANKAETVLSADFMNDDSISADSICNNENNGYRVIVCEEGNSVVLDGLTICGGYGVCESGNAAQFAGCGLFLNAWNEDNNAKITLLNCKVKNNSGMAKGAGLYFKGSLCEFRNCQFEGNRSDLKDKAGSIGGAIYIDAFAASFDGCNIENNSALHGGGISFNGVTCILANNTFTLNRSYDGGGAVRFTGNELYINNSIFDKNISFDGSGGAVSFRGRILELDKCRAVENNCYGTGGVVDFEGDSCNVYRSDFINNSTQTFGGVFKASGKKIVFDSCKFTQNSARTKNGGVIYCEADCLKISKSLFKDCSAGKGNGGSIYFLGKEANVNDNRFIGGFALSGGAVYVEQDVFRTDKKVNLADCEFMNCKTEISGDAICFYGNAQISRCSFKNGENSTGVLIDNRIHHENDKIKYFGFNTPVDTIRLRFEKSACDNNLLDDSKFLCPENPDFSDIVLWTGRINNCKYNGKPVSEKYINSKKSISMINE